MYKSLNIHRRPHPPKKQCLLVVGTTEDYIAWIEACYHKKVLFLVEKKILPTQGDFSDSHANRVYSNLSNYDQTISDLLSYSAESGCRVEGVVCFDCEYLNLASHIARTFNLPYPSMHSVDACRNKHRFLMLLIAPCKKASCSVFLAS